MEELLAKLDAPDEHAKSDSILFMDEARIHIASFKRQFYNEQEIRLLINHSYCPE